MQVEEIAALLFLAFFAIIGVCSVLVMIGVFKHADPGFKKWAWAGFAASVLGACVGLVNQWRESQGWLYVTLRSASEAGAVVPDLRSGVLQYDVVSDKGEVKPKQLSVQVGLGSGGWQVQLPRSVVDKVVRLYFKDAQGNWWCVRGFYPNYTYQDLSPGSPPTTIAERRSPLGGSVVLAASPEQLALLQTPVSSAEAPRFDNYARTTSQQYGRQFYVWRIFVDEPRQVLDRISAVEYVLHPTFPEPVQLSKDRDNHFEIVGHGWGGFRVVVTIRFMDGRQVKTSYMLDLSKPWPQEPAKP